jgi:flagellar hook protein FlgE
MGIFGIMRTGVSGMAAQASKLSAAGDNIANVNTVGYKRASTEFSSFISEGGRGEYNSGGVDTITRYAISDEGVAMGSTSPTDLAIKGKGFFVVSDASGTPYMTRAGAFVPNANKELLNSAGFYLMGYPLKNGEASVVANSLDGLERVNLAGMAYEATPSTTGTLQGNLDSNAAIVGPTAVPPTVLPSANTAASVYSNKASIVTYDTLGNKVLLDVYMSKTSDTTWEATVFNKAGADPTTGGFPYTGAAPIAQTATLTFDATTGAVTSAPANFDVIVQPGDPKETTIQIDFSALSQTGADTAVELSVNGNAPSAVEDVEIAADGTVYAVFDNGSRLATYRIPLANVASPDQLTPESGNVYSVNAMSGDPIVGFPGEGSLGDIQANALEQSNVDLASELTAMIESQRSYTANSKVFQTGSELLDVLVNLKR